METALKQRLLGAAVLVALAVTFLPLLVMERAPDSGASNVSLRVPPAPGAGGDTRTVELPLAAPSANGPVLATPVTAPADEPAPTPPVPTGPATAGGDYAVNFGSYATASDAARVITALAAARLPAYQEATALGARTVHRVRIGPYATAADAEAARIAAGQVRGDVNAKVVVLDANGAASTAPAATSASPRTPAATAATPSVPVATTTVTAGTERPTPAASEPPKPPTPPAPAPAATPAASSVGFAVQLGAFANPDEAARLRDRARGAGFPAFVEQVRTDRGVLNRVRVGPVPDRTAADALRGQVSSKLGVSGIVRPHP